MKLGMMAFLFSAIGAAGTFSGAYAGQVGKGNVSNPKMCVCEPCGGIMVPCQNLKKPAPDSDEPSCSGASCGGPGGQKTALPAKSSN